MARRILLLMMPVLGLLIIGAVVTSGLWASQRNTQTVHADRVGDATRFAAIVADAITVDDFSRAGAELDAYSGLYGSPVWVLGLDGSLLHDPGTPLPDEPAVAEAVDRGLAGVRVAEVPMVWPWHGGPLYTVEPVGQDSQVTAVVVIEAPTDRLRATIGWQWSVAAAVLMIPLLGLVVGMWPMTRWTLRPVRDLEATAARVSAGDLDARADPDSGPPELRELTVGFNTMVGTVQSALQRQQAFVADAAHQIRHPMSGLRLSLDALEPAIHDPQAREAYDDAVAESQRMSSMLESMLAAAARTGAGGAGQPTGQVAAILLQGGERWQLTADDAAMQLRVGLVDRSVLVREPTGGLAAALDELVGNAARLSAGERIEITVAPGDTTPASTVRISVADDGVGLTEQQRVRATSRFWRADRQQNVPGTGLGLSILADAVTDVGGVIELAENPGGGLRVTIELPRLSEPPG